MALDSTLSAENIKASLEKYLYDNLVTTSSLKVHWEGAKDLDLTNIDEWVQPRALYAEPRNFSSGVEQNKKGWERPILLNINIFLRKGSTTNLHRLAELRDTVAQYFDIGQTIPLKDYRGTGASIDDFIVREIMTDSNLPTGDQLYWQWTFTPILMLIQRWTG